jgi:PAS domain S-box-containing protein
MLLSNIGSVINRAYRQMKNPKGPDTDPSQNSQDERRRRMISRLLLTAIGMLLGMTAYESFKQLLFPAITVWQSHMVTIIFSAFIAVLVAYLVARKTDLLLERIAEENTMRQKSEDSLRLSEEKFSKLFHANPDWVIISSLKDGRYIDVNDAFLRMTGYNREEIVGHTSLELNIWVEPNERKAMIPILQQKGRIINHEVRFRMKSGEIRFMLRSAELIELGGEAATISVCKDISDRNQASIERDRLVEQLEESLSKVKLLSGMLPICSSCKRIRDNEGGWFQMESYIKERSEAEFTHGLCPDCADKLYPQFYKKSSES